MNKIIASVLLFFSASTYTYTNIDIQAIGNTFYAEGAVARKKERPQVEHIMPEIFSNGIFTESLR